MGDIGIRYYFFDGVRIMRVGIDTKKLFPKLTGSQVPWVTVIYHRSNKEILSIRLDPANINSAGEWTHNIEDRYAAQALDEVLTKKSDKVASLRHRQQGENQTDRFSKRDILRNRIGRELGAGAWDRVSAQMKRPCCGQQAKPSSSTNSNSGSTMIEELRRTDQNSKRLEF